MNFSRLRVFVVAVVSCLSVLAYAQTAQTALHGTVFDPSGAVIPGATVTISISDIGYSRVLQTGSKGEYAFAQIPPGQYTIRVEAAGYGAKTTIAQLLVNQPSTVNVTMAISAETTVSVDDTAPVLSAGCLRTGYAKVCGDAA